MARRQYRIHFPRSLKPFALTKAYSSLRALIADGDYDILHCHTPIPSALTRLAARGWRKRGGKVLYTAHGFHFYKGGPVKNWVLYYPAELLLSHLTDLIVTINSEDFSATQNRLWGAASAKIPGIGIQPRGFAQASADERRLLRSELGFEEDDFILLYVAEFIPRKNHRFIVESVPELRALIPGVRVVFLGRGQLLEASEGLASRLGVQEAVRFMGFRENVADFARIADIGICASRHEGLGIALLEQMLCAVPVVASSERGHREFVENGKTGFLFRQNDRQQFISYIKKLHDDRTLLQQMGAEACRKAQEFTLGSSMNEMATIYERFLS